MVRIEESRGKALEVVEEAEKQVLSLISPPYSCIIAILRSLAANKTSRSSIKNFTSTITNNCSFPSIGLEALEELGIIKCNEEECIVSEIGSKLVYLISDFHTELVSLVDQVINNSYGREEIALYTAFPLATLVGYVSSHSDDRELSQLLLSVQMYMVGLVSLVLGELSMKDPRIIDILQNISGISQ